MGLGICIMGRSLPFLVVYIILFAAVYLRIIRTEEKNMEEIFGKEYASYKRNVPLLFPRITAWISPGMESGTPPIRGQSHFQWGSVWRNREYQAWMGIAVVVGVLYLKLLAIA